MNPHIHILVLNWNGKEVLNNCLHSISKIDYKNYSTIVIDNASTDNSIELVKKNFSNVEVLQLKKNYGYSSGYNQGFEFLKEKNKEYILLLNNDTEVHRNILKKFINGVEKFGKNEIYGGKIYYLNDKKKIWFAGGLINLKYLKISHIGIRKYDSTKYCNPIETNYITGCCFFTSWHTIEKLNGFNERFNMYGEDVDLCLRAKKKNIKCYFLPDVKLWHHVSYSLGGNFSFKKMLLKMKSIIKIRLDH